MTNIEDIRMDVTGGGVATPSAPEVADAVGYARTSRSRYHGGKQDGVAHVHTICLLLDALDAALSASPATGEGLREALHSAIQSGFVVLDCREPGAVRMGDWAAVDALVPLIEARMALAATTLDLHPEEPR